MEQQEVDLQLPVVGGVGHFGRGVVEDIGDQVEPSDLKPQEHTHVVHGAWDGLAQEVEQLVEQSSCNRKVASSIPSS